MTSVSSLPPPHEPFPRHESSSSLGSLKRRSQVDHGVNSQQTYKHDRVSRPSRVNKTRANRISRQRKRPSLHSWGPDDEDGRRLAADPNVVLPSDHIPGKPQLKRQEAFRKPKSWHYSDVVDDDADLYKLGLLYDDERSRGSYFSLDTIIHSEPIYSIRPAKRARKQRQDTSYLHLDLSFASSDSGSDIQQYLAPDVALLTPPADEDVPETQNVFRDNINPERSYRDAALSVIHELPESSSPSFDTHAPKATDFSDLVSDHVIEDKEGEEQEDDQDWALLDTDILSTTDTDADVEAEDTIDAASGTGEAWIVLGDGS
ncbi:hypothetical protein F5Y13DRAFT_189091 [Hypoxylon sp. FL1857]|nr:hypothetical protein F5Y13DRAFT_189091 [Hypoxylon sp. FL1857]